MIQDILTVMWKERREQANQETSRRDRIIGWLMPIMSLGIATVYPPLIAGPKWVTSPLVLFVTLVVPLMVVGMGVVDAFAGERERHTLESLLATRLPDRAILFGKIAGPVVLALQFTVGLHLAALVALNLAHWQGFVLVYPLPMVGAILALATLVALASSALGVLISLKAETVRQATQRMMTASLAPGMGIGLALVAIAKVAPASWREAFERFFKAHVMTADMTQVTVVALGLLLVVDVVLLVGAMYRFRRSRLVVS